MQQSSKLRLCTKMLTNEFNPCIVAVRGCLLVRQSFFHNDPKNFSDVGGGVLGCRGFHSSFRTTQSGLSLNIGNVLLLYMYFPLYYTYF